MTDKEASPTAPVPAVRAKKAKSGPTPPKKQALQGGAAGGLPGPSGQVPEKTGALTRRVKVLFSIDRGPLRAREIGVRKDEDGVDKMVEADGAGVDQLVDLPGPLEVSEAERRINGIELKAGEEFIYQLK